MKSLLLAAEAQTLDAELIRRWRLEEGTLMEAAAFSLARALAERLGPPGPSSPPVLALAGPGNNGGDALAMLRHLRFAGYPLLGALLPDAPLKPLPARQAASLAAGGIPLFGWRSPEGRRALAEAGLLLDGISGTGLSGGLRGEAAEMLKAVAEGRSEAARIVAIDLPSGFRDGAEAGEPRLAAELCLAIEPRKACLYAPALRPLAGEILPVEGVFPRDSRGSIGLLETGDLEELRPTALPEAHKGSRGRLGILAGSLGMSGALLLASRAAQAAGAGLVSLYLREELMDKLGASSPEVLGGSVLRPEKALAAELGGLDALLAGPGWGRDEGRRRLLGLLLDSDLPLVLDADALRLLAELPARPRSAPLLLCPHPGEFSSLTGLEAPSFLHAPAAPLLGLARERRASVILKASCSWIASPEGRISVLEGLEPGLAVAGSGDVLAGLAGGLLAGLSAGGTEPGPELGHRVLSLAALVHREAGLAARRELGWFEASALPPRAAFILGAGGGGRGPSRSGPRLDPGRAGGYSQPA